MTMIYRLLIAIVVITFSFMTAPTSVSAKKNLKKKKVEASEEVKRAKRGKSLLSALLLMDLVSPRKQVRTKAGSITVPDMKRTKNVYPLSYLEDPALKQSAVEELYRNHGYNRAVKTSLRKFTRHKYSFKKRLKRSGMYIEEMADIFDKEGLPRELAFLPLIESEFDPFAYSRRRAAGPWQFMPATARLLDLKVDWWIDERRDPVKSTKAAASYLKYLNEKFDSWNLTLAAYNAGEGRIRSALKKVESKDYWTLRKSRYIAGETKNYVPSYIAATAIAMNPENFGFRYVDYQKPSRYDEVIITSPMDLEVIARFAGVKTIDIRKLNPELRRLCTPPNVQSYKLKIPRGTKRKFLKNVDRTKGKEAQYINLYTVRRGDTVEKIAKNIGATMQKIVEMNDLGRRALIMAGKKILVPIERNWDWLIK